MLDFKAWQATCKSVPDLNEYYDYKPGKKVPGYMYEGMCVIEKNVGADIDTYGRYTLTMSNWSEASNSLSYLEYKLYNNHYKVEAD